MRRTASVPARAALACSVVLTVALSVRATAADLCVHCSGPVATYRCIADGGEADPRLNLACITEMARFGRHETCAIRNAEAGFCPGPPYRLSLPAEQPGQARAAAVAREPAAPSPAQDAQPPAPPRNPDHPLEKVGDSLNRAGEQIGRAGEAVGGTARRSWECVTSLFKSC